MPVGIGFGRGPEWRPGVVRPSRFISPKGVHPGALWIAAAAPVVATLLLMARLAG